MNEPPKIDRISQIILEDNFDENRYLVPPRPKEKDQRGFIYAVYDEKYPTLIKVGKTIDFVKRVKQYNIDRPYEDVRPVLCTNLIHNCDYMEKVIKNDLIKTYGSAGKSQEWFLLDALQRVWEILEFEDLPYKTFGECPIGE